MRALGPNRTARTRLRSLGKHPTSGFLPGKTTSSAKCGGSLDPGDPGKIGTPDPATTPLHAVYPPGPYIVPKARAMIEFLTARFGAETEWDGGPDMARGA